jgi:1,5-anhydro-D-fructose reductase (1,5-anhydro-D-mannitol-forming)
MAVTTGDRLRILVIGLGLIGRRRARAVLSIADRLPVQLAGIVDPVAEPLEAVPHHRSLDQVRADEYDAAVVCVPHDVAPELAARVLAEGRPVLLEKPLAVTGDLARELTERACAVAAPSLVGYNYRFLPAVSALLDAHSGGRLGELRNVDMLLGHGGHPGSAEGWKLRPERAGGGVLLDPGVHLLDLLLKIEPRLRCAHVAATRGFWRTGIEEDLVATLSHERLLATVRVSHVRWINTFRIEAGGEDGYAIVEGRGGNYGPQIVRFGRRWAWRDGGGRTQAETEESRDFGIEDPSFELELEAVLRRWLGEQPPEGPSQPATFPEALAVAELCDHMYAMLRG